MLSVSGNASFTAAQGLLFNNNFAHLGGALYSSGYASAFIGPGVTILSNSCPRETGGMGGAVAIDEQSRVLFKVVVSALAASNMTSLAGDVSFVYNTAYNGGAIVSLQGAAIFLPEANMTVTFVNNSAHQGGAIYAMNNAQLHATAGDQLFINNTAWFGGAVFTSGHSNMSCSSTTSTAKSKSNFENNSAQFGGAIGADDSGSIHLGPGCLLYYNTASDSGAAAYATAQGVVHLNGAVVRDCTAKRRAGAYSGEGDSLLPVGTGTQFVNCSAAQSGGAVAQALNSQLKLLGADMLCRDCMSGSGGGCVQATDAAQVVISTNSALSVVNCNARSNGGGVQLLTGGRLTVEPDSMLLVQGCRVPEGAGGGIAALGSSIINLLSNDSNNSAGMSSYSSNACAVSASGNPGGLDSTSSSHTTHGLLVINNTFGSNGAGIALLESSAQLCVTGNRAAKTAGGVLLQGSIHSYDNSVSNSAEDSDALAIAGIATAVHGNFALTGDIESSPVPDSLKVLQVLPDLDRFVSREGREQGLMQIFLRVSGKGFPVQVRASKLLRTLERLLPAEAVTDRS